MMKIRFVLFTLLTLWGTTTAWASVPNESTLTFGRFGTVHLYRQNPQPKNVVIFISGDGGWNLGVVDMTRELAGLDSLVVGVDIIHYLKSLDSSKEKCFYPPADFESLSKYVQKQLNYPNYIQPVLVGYSSGATLVYAVLAQAPVNTFKAGLSLGFCPDLPLALPPCKAGVLTWNKDPKKPVYYFLPVKQLENPWIAFQGEIDQVCNSEETRSFVSQISGAEIVMLPKVGHGFSVPKNWLPQFRQAFTRLTAPQSQKIKPAQVDLPVVEVPAIPPAKPEMAILLTGDGGWAGIDRQISGELAAQGVGVVALDSLKYYWTARTPDGAAKDLAKLVDYYLDAWHKEKAILIGYSLGADVLPFLAARMPEQIRQRVELVALLGPARATAFEFHLSDWVGGSNGKDNYPVRPEMDRIEDLPVLCFYGKDEHDSLCRDPLPKNVTVIPMTGGHHLGGDYSSIVARILKAMDQ